MPNRRVRDRSGEGPGLLAPLVHAAMRQLPGEAPLQIGNWDLVRMLGSGADADVFLAQHRDNARKVAVKLVRHDSTTFYDRRRHLDEIRAIIAIDHRNVVRLYEAGELDDRRIYLVMEHLEGTTLRTVLDTRGPLGPSVLLQIGLLVARGLGAAHARGIVHRDLKPSNVMVIPTGSGRFTIKLIDFGIAKFIDGKTCTIVGTPAYMSPEAVRGDPLDHRTDLYSFGVLLHHCATGAYPDRERSVVFDVRGSRTPIRNARECTLETIIDRCLRRDPAHRYPTTAHLIGDLEIARARLKQGLPRAPRGTPSDGPTQSWWNSDDTVFSTHQDACTTSEQSTSVRLGVPAMSARPRLSTVPPGRAPTIPPIVGRAPSPKLLPPPPPPMDVSGVLVVPEASPAHAAGPAGFAQGYTSLPPANGHPPPMYASLPPVSGVLRPSTARAPSTHAEPGTRTGFAARMRAMVAPIAAAPRGYLIAAMLVVGFVLGAVLPIAHRDRDPAQAPSASTVAPAPPPPPIVEPIAAPAPSAVLERASCAPVVEPPTGPPSRSIFAYLRTHRDEQPRRPKAKAKRKKPVEKDDEIEIQSDD